MVGCGHGLINVLSPAQLQLLERNDDGMLVTGVLLTYERTVGKWRTVGNNIDNSQESRTGVNASSIRTKL